jgi:hypothetical protein
MVTKFTVPNMDKGRKATCILTGENIFPVKVFSLICIKNTSREKNSQYPSVNDLVQQLLVTNNNMMSLTSLPCLF